MKEIRLLPAAEQAEHFRALFEYLDQQYMDLIENYHLMVPPWTDQTLIDRYNRTNRARGLDLVRDSLLDTCILSITKLLFDGDDTNPSLLTMVRPFLRSNREKYAELLKILELDYSDWERTITGEKRRETPPEILEMFDKQDREAALARHAEFQERMDRVASDWPALYRASQTFTDVRNKWIAHLN